MLNKEKEINEVASFIEMECDSIKSMLLAKNKKYGNSAFSPLNIFSRLNSIEGIKIRIDDKLSRIVRGNNIDDEEKHEHPHKNDTILDLIGYLILLRINSKIQYESTNTKIR